MRPVDIGKPRMRGWLHAYAFFVALVCGVVLCSIAATRPGWAPLVSCAIYSLTVCGLFGISALYHRITWRPPVRRWMRRLDHAPANRTRVPGASSAGGSRCTSKSDTSVRPTSRHPPGERVG